MYYNTQFNPYYQQQPMQYQQPAMPFAMPPPMTYYQMPQPPIEYNEYDGGY
jgi:hypothetical protein